MKEIDLVNRIRTLTGSAFPRKQLIRGIGDDCAVFRPRAHEDLVFTTDLCLESQHFTLKTHTAADIGHKALARSLSDLAAMGAEPLFCLVSLALPSFFRAQWVRAFYRGLFTLADHSGTIVAGGDLARAATVICDVMCCGKVPKNGALLRSGARAGDNIYVTGELGASALGLATQRGAAWRRHKRPEPRLAAGLALRSLASAAMDLSDGLSLDLHRLCLESGVAAQLTGSLPVARGATLDQALHGGEDYELLFTASPRTKIPPAIAGLPVTKIGAIQKGRPGSIISNGKPVRLLGFDHFK